MSFVFLNFEFLSREKLKQFIYDIEIRNTKYEVWLANDYFILTGGYFYINITDNFLLGFYRIYYYQQTGNIEYN